MRLHVDFHVFYHRVLEIVCPHCIGLATAIFLTPFSLLPNIAFHCSRYNLSPIPGTCTVYFFSPPG